jgi:predicted Fe-S protein YdhL (DUF1289 family)
MMRTPCNNVCQLDFETGWCLGCGRTGQEIQDWLKFTDAERDAVIDSCPDRLRAMGLPLGGDVEEAERRAAAQRLRPPPARG